MEVVRFEIFKQPSGWVVLICYTNAQEILIYKLYKEAL
jgi:hypothetical protein